MFTFATLGSAALALAAPASPAAAPSDPGPLPPYAESIRCAGLAEAAGALRPRERGLFDGALFWGLAASEAARKAKYSAKRFTRDQKRAAAAARRELKARGSSAEAELEACLARVPQLKS